MNTEKQIKNYITRQNNWLKANNIKEGDKVLVLREHEDTSKGWDAEWNIDMNKEISTIQKILYICTNKEYGIRTQNIITASDWSYPYTVLLPVDNNGIFETRKFISGMDNSEQTCIVQTNASAKDGEFFYQVGTYKGNVIRKITDATNLMETAKRKGYYPYGELWDSKPKVIASTLTGIGLPILKYPEISN
jgi:hypothetical protein